MNQITTEEVSISDTPAGKRAPVVIRKLDQLEGLPEAEQIALAPVTDKFAFRVSPYYSDLIDWSDPNDPLRKIVLPSLRELDSELEFDASAEAANTKVRGLQHKYRRTALLLVNDFCAAYCRFCFRKRFTLATTTDAQIVPDNATEGTEKETTFDVSDGIAYIAEHEEIDNVLLTGGDPLMLAPSRLKKIMDSVREIPHVKIIRIGTKVPPFEPGRINDAMLDVLSAASTPGKRVYLMVHYNHPRELTDTSLAAMREAQRRGITVYNQTPLLRGINDDVETLVELFNGLARNGITPYYLFHCRPTVGNEEFMMSMQDGSALVKKVRAQLGGLARCFRYSGSHESGKIEIIGDDGNQVVFRYHQAKNPLDEGRLMYWPSSEPILWFDEVLQRNAPIEV